MREFTDSISPCNLLVNTTIPGLKKRCQPFCLVNVLLFASKACISVVSINSTFLVNVRSQGYMYRHILPEIHTLRLLLMREMILRHMDSRTNMQLKFNTIAAPRAKGNPP